MRRFNPTTRRAVIAGTSLTATLALLGVPARAQSDGFRTIRARDTGYDGTVPGPVLRVKRGEEVKVRLVNESADETAIHWHGVRVPNAMDGTALTQRPVPPGASFDYRFRPPDAGTFWYHPPIRTPNNRALYGLLIVDEPRPADVDRDLALILDASSAGFTANGLASLDIPVTANERVRLRLINAADRFITLRLDHHPVAVMAIDGQPAEPFGARDSRVTFSPGNRADLFFDAVLEPGSLAPLVVQDDTTDVQLARLVYAESAVARPQPRGAAAPLAANNVPERIELRGARRVDLALDAIAGDQPERPHFTVPRGRTVVLAIANRAAAPQVLHIHGHHVRLLDALDDGWKPFWLDTILCMPRQTTRVAFVADNVGKWLLHARAVGADGRTLAWFEVG
jgi:FtsP/CotA-like multicopper oxidase with cupredoxin domain